MAQVKGVHMVGSVPLPDAESVFRQCCAGQPSRLKRIPDGEPGLRNMFTVFQSLMFQASPELCTKFEMNVPLAHGTFNQKEVDDAVEKLKSSGPLETGYDTVAIESYQTFKKLKDEGVISKETRFQVSIPTTPNVVSVFVQSAFQSKVAPLYKDALYRAVRNLQDHVPHEELAIQIDEAVDTMFWEGIEMYKPWWGEGNIDKIREYIVDYTVEFIAQIDKDVEVGIHNCYGDMEHRHWMEPTSLRVITDRALRIYEKSPHTINFFHCPVPKSAIDDLEAYLEPLKELIPKFTEHKTDLYLGVVHEYNKEMTDKMIATAQKVLGDYPFGVATECGWGRTKPEVIGEIMKISTEVSEPAL